jgi:hypothetical protein
MKQTDDAALVVGRPRGRRVWRLVYILPVVFVVLLVAALFFPVLDGPHSGQRVNQTVAVSKLLAIKLLQTKYLAAHPEKGFACQLAWLKPAEPLDHNYDPLAFLVTGTLSGYKFALENCHADAEGVVVHYQATAVPVENGVTGFRAFCMDESGVIWNDKGGSAAKCLASRRPFNFDSASTRSSIRVYRPRT